MLRRLYLAACGVAELRFVERLQRRLGFVEQVEPFIDACQQDARIGAIGLAGEQLLHGEFRSRRVGQQQQAARKIYLQVGIVQRQPGAPGLEQVLAAAEVQGQCAGACGEDARTWCIAIAFECVEQRVPRGEIFLARQLAQANLDMRFRIGGVALHGAAPGRFGFFGATGFGEDGRVIAPVHRAFGLHLGQTRKCMRRVVAAVLRVQAQSKSKQRVDMIWRRGQQAATQAFGFDRVAGAECSADFGKDCGFVHRKTRSKKRAARFLARPLSLRCLLDRFDQNFTVTRAQ